MPPNWRQDCARTGHDAKTSVLSLSHFSISRDNEITIPGTIMLCHSFVIMPSAFFPAGFCDFLIDFIPAGGSMSVDSLAMCLTGRKKRRKKQLKNKSKV